MKVKVLPDIKSIQPTIDNIENATTMEKNVALSMLRLDNIHPQVSGNKLFKLHFFIKRALSSSKKIITFGGAYSNHLAATATMCRDYGIKCIGIVRGERPENLSHTLQYCLEQEMELQFISREKYAEKNDKRIKDELRKKYPYHIVVPEGGFGKEGMQGAALIPSFYKTGSFTHICCAVGTATTLAGLICSASAKETIVGFSALKNLNDFEERIQTLVSTTSINYSLIENYHFGGYAKKTDELLNFMNEFYRQTNIPTDFVYTGKMMFGVFDLIKKNYFTKGSKILCVHTGGLQGNFSLPDGTLNF